MARKDWIPGREQDLVDLCGKWKAALENHTNIGVFGWDQMEIVEVSSKITAFLTSRADYELDNSTAKRLAKDETKEEAVDAMRDFANSSIRFNKKMDDPQKLALGIHPKDLSHTVHGKPESQPDMTVENTANHYEHRIRALNRENGTSVKPADAYGVHYVWQVGGEKPASGADIRGQTKFSRKTNMVVTHTESDKAKPCFYSCCYENGKGDQGGWAPVIEAIIG